MIRLHVVPALGSKRLERLTAADVRVLLNGKRDAGLAANTIRHIHALLRVAPTQAVREDLAPRNVASLVQVPMPPAADVRPLDVEEARRLLDAARGDRLYALWEVALGIGLRRGEALGLHWQDVDLEAGALRVEQTLQRTGGRLVLAPPKTARSRRTVPLPPVCVAALRAHRVAQAREQLAVGPAWQDSGLVFTTGLGTAIEPRNVNRSFAALCRRAGLRPIRLHDLRHTCATLLLAHGVSARVVMETLGHSQIAITMNTYTHVLPVLQREAADRMDALLSGDVAVTVAVNGPDAGGDEGENRR